MIPNPELTEFLTYEESAPTITEVLSFFQQYPERPNPELHLGHTTIQSISGQPHISEKEAVENTIGFLELVRDVAGAGSDPYDKDIYNEVNAYLENLRYIGEYEFDKAIDFFANMILRQIEAGEKVTFYVPGVRSELYVTAKLIESIRSKYYQDEKEKPPLPLRYTSHASNIPVDSSRVYIADDFIITGGRIRSSCENVELSDPIQLEKLEIIAVCASDSQDISVLDRTIPIKAYYGVNEYTYGTEQLVNVGGVSITGSHCSTDYGFEVVLTRYKRFLSTKGKSYTELLPVGIRRPYQRSLSGEYNDPEYAQLIEKMKGYEI